MVQQNSSVPRLQNIKYYQRYHCAAIFHSSSAQDAGAQENVEVFQEYHLVCRFGSSMNSSV